MKTIFTLLALFLLLQSCDLFVSPDMPEDINLQLKKVNQKGDFDEIHVSGSTDLVVEQGEKYEVKLKGNKNHFKYFILEVEDGELNCSTANGPRNLDVIIHVFMPKLKEIDLSGAGNVVLHSFEDMKDLNLDLSGAGSFVTSGEKPFKIKNLTVSISGAGSVEAESLMADNVEVDVSGAGNAVVHAQKTLVANVSGVGSIEYSGNPKVKKHVSGVGTISKK